MRMENLARDLRHAGRSLHRTPGFTAVAVLTLALGVGANTAVFSLIEGVLLRPLPYPQPERLVRIFVSGPTQPKFPVSPLDLVDYRLENRVFTGIAGYTREDLQMSEERLGAMRVTHDFFQVLGFRPAFGRTFTRDEELNEARVVILSDTLWRRRFGGDRGVLGRTVRINGQPFEVVGVMPQGFQHVGGDYRSLPHGETVDAWWPVDLNPKRVRRGWHYINVVARLKPAVALADAQADMTRLSAELARRYPDSNANWNARVTSLDREVVGRARPGLLLLLAAAGVVLLIACVNIANLLLARGSTRRREAGIRWALGASRAALVRLAAAESLVIAVAGGVCGTAAAIAGVRALRAVMPADFPRLHAIDVNPQMLLYAAAVSLATVLLFGVAPALQRTRVDPAAAMRGGRATASGGLLRLRGILAAAQVALATALLFVAALLVRSLIELNRTDPGFNPRGVLTFSISLPQTMYSKPESMGRFHVALADRLRRIPGVLHAGAATSLPWTGWDENTSFDIVGDTVTRNAGPEARFGSATPGFLKAMGIPLRGGRDLTDADRDGAPRVLLVNESLARKFLDGAALGRKLDIWGDRWEIVGVFADIKDAPADDHAVPAFFWPHAQQPFRSMAFAVRAAADPVSLVSAVRAAVRETDREIPVAEVRTLDAVGAAALAQRRFVLAMVGVFAALAVALAGVGTYGVLAYLVEQRRREIAVRIAIGASAGRILREFLQNGLAIGFAGLAAGVALSLAGARLIAGLLYGVAPRDWPTVAAVAALSALLAVAASFIPARRAARMEPQEVLRED
jgi:predicted permease